MRKFILSFLFLPFILSANDLEKTNILKIDVHYGYGNFFTGFDHQDYADKSYYNEVLISIEKNAHRKFGYSFILNTTYNKEKGFGTCEGTIPINYNVNANAFLGSALMHLNWKYTGVEFGFLAYKRERGYCDENPDLSALYPILNLKIGLIERLYFSITCPEDLVLAPITAGINYHFDNYFSNIWIGRTFDSGELDLYSGKIQLEVFDKILLTGQGFINFSRNIKGVRVGVGYIFKLAG
jgi:hypothetical protein